MYLEYNIDYSMYLEIKFSLVNRIGRTVSSIYLIMELIFLAGVARSGITKPYRENDTNVFGL